MSFWKLSLILTFTILLSSCGKIANLQSQLQAISEKGLAVTENPLASTPQKKETVKIKKIEGEGIRWAIIIGINDYNDPKILDLTFASRDAETISAILKEKGEFDTVYTLISSNKPDLQPTKTNIIRTLDFIAANAEKADTVLLYYSGHGFAVDGDNYMCVQDSNLDDVKATGINIGDIFSTLKKSKSKVNLAFIDACREDVTEGTKSIGVKSFTEAEYKDAEGIAVLFATRFGDYSFEDKKLGMGVFSYYIKEGLLGKGDYNNDNYISFKEIEDYVIKKVNEWSRSNMKSQKPFIAGEWSGDVLLTKKGSSLSTEEISNLTPIQVVDRYLKVWDWKERLPYILDPEKNYAAMNLAYRNFEFKGESQWDDKYLISAENFGGPAVTDKNISVILVVDKNQTTVTRIYTPSFYILKNSNSGWKVDWPDRGIPDSPTRLDLLKVEQPKSAGEARKIYGFIEFDDYYNYQFRNREDDFYSFSINIPRNNSFDRINGYAPKNSSQGKAIASLISESKWVGVPVTLKVAYITEGTNHSDSDLVDIISLEHPYFY